jgi:hypothetical protein
LEKLNGKRRRKGTKRVTKKTNKTKVERKCISGGKFRE